MASQKGLKPVSHVLQSLLDNSKLPLSKEYKTMKLMQQWDQVVGPQMASHTEPLRYHNGKLFIHVDHPTWLQEYIFLGDQIKDNINQHFGYKWVRAIHFTQQKDDSTEGEKKL